jgi:hypothetical protein
MRRLMPLRHANPTATPGCAIMTGARSERREAAAKWELHGPACAGAGSIVASTAKRVTETLDLMLPAFEQAPKIGLRGGCL